MQIEINHFVKRQTAESRFSHYEPRSGDVADTWSELASLVSRYATDATLITSVTPDNMVLKLSLPEEACQGFFSGVVRVDAETVFQTSYGKRQGAVEEEAPYIQVYALGGRKAPAVRVDIILYHRSQLTEAELTAIGADGRPYVQQGEWQVISVNARDTVEAEPPTPMAMARNMAAALNMPEGAGGSARLYTPEDYMRSILYWGQHSMSPGK